MATLRDYHNTEHAEVVRLTPMPDLKRKSRIAGIEARCWWAQFQADPGPYVYISPTRSDPMTRLVRVPDVTVGDELARELALHFPGRTVYVMTIIKTTPAGTTDDTLRKPVNKNSFEAKVFITYDALKTPPLLGPTQLERRTWMGGFQMTIEGFLDEEDGIDSMEFWTRSTSVDVHEPNPSLSP